VEAIRELAPDVVLLDVQMPELDGFEVVQAVASGPLPAVVFVTAHDQYALRAFDVHALDYLLKPVDVERLRRSLDRVREWRATRADAHDPGVVGLLKQLVADRRFLRRLPVRIDGRLLIVDVSDVEWVSAADNYVVLHVRGKELMLRSTLAALEQQLDPSRFARVHRSSLVQIDRIRELVPESHGDVSLILKDGTTVALSRNYRAHLEQLIAGR
jgi:two-component system LytT family response regulator